LLSYQSPITTIACPSIGNGVKIALDITVGGDKSSKKKGMCGRLILRANGSLTP
jgi:hypothetical protein